MTKRYSKSSSCTRNFGASQKDAIHKHQQVLKGIHESESTLDGLRSQGARFKPAEHKQRQRSKGESFEPGRETYSSSKTGNWKQPKQCMRCSILGVPVLLLMSPVIDVTTRDILVHNVDPGQYMRYKMSQVWTQSLSTHSHKLHPSLGE